MACKELQEWLSLRVTRVEAAYMYTCLQRRARVCCMYSRGEGPLPLGGFSLSQHLQLAVGGASAAHRRLLTKAAGLKLGSALRGAGAAAGVPGGAAAAAAPRGQAAAGVHRGRGRARRVPAAAHALPGPQRACNVRAPAAPLPSAQRTHCSIVRTGHTSCGACAGSMARLPVQPE